MADQDELHLLRRIARLYWLEDKDQAEIGRLLGISKSTVSRKLSAARSAGIVQVRVAGAERVERAEDLEQEILRRFPLRDVFVADVDPGVDPIGGVGRLAAEVLVQQAPLASRIGFGWGRTISAIIAEVPPTKLRQGTEFTSIVGGMPSVDTGPSGNHLIFNLADTCGVTARRFDAPAVVESPVTQEALMQESTVAKALEFGRQCDLAFVGVGAFGILTSASVLEAMRLSPEETETVLAAKPIGDVLGRFYDQNGVPLGSPSADRVIALEIDDLRRIPTVVAVASGVEKIRGVLGGLRTEAFDVLVVDRRLAESLISAERAAA
jgi:DNA-binding transcriptional regulator LsrR (DeoR family)